MRSGFLSPVCCNSVKLRTSKLLISYFSALEILQAMGVRCKKITPSDWNNFGKEIKISSKWNTADDINQYYKV